jgi:hypothetical protein
MSRYLICVSWNHLFTEDGRDVERTTRFAYDVERGAFAVADIQRGHKWHAASPAEMADLRGSLVVANSDAFSSPADWGCTLSDTLPDGD